jgi:hypothetical protein
MRRNRGWDVDEAQSFGAGVQDGRDYPWTRDLRKYTQVINPRMSMGIVGNSGFQRSVTNQVASPVAEQE